MREMSSSPSLRGHTVLLLYVQWCFARNGDILVNPPIYNCPRAKPVRVSPQAETNGRQQNCHQRRPISRFTESSRVLVVGTTVSASTSAQATFLT